jgi:transcriptional regulator with XRE-family HTH domain
MIGNRDEKILKEFGNKLKKIRLSKKLSLRNLAHEADMDWSGINRIEKGISNPTLTTIMALAEALQIDPRDLLHKDKSG